MTLDDFRAQVVARFPAVAWYTATGEGCNVYAIRAIGVPLRVTAFLGFHPPSPVRWMLRLGDMDSPHAKTLDDAATGLVTGIAQTLQLARRVGLDVP